MNQDTFFVVCVLVTTQVKKLCQKVRKKIKIPMIRVLICIYANFRLNPTFINIAEIRLQYVKIQ